ncbi:MAG: hypothetical protein K2K84_08595 [Muribaculaceae bacterium]|nr:hypothetical protein [Muribaculaceae bacterium]
MKVNINININNRHLPKNPLRDLCRTYRRIMVLGFCFAFCLWPPLLHLGVPTWVIIAYSVLMLLSGILSAYMLHEMRKVPMYMSLPVCEAQKKLRRIDGLRWKTQRFELMLAIPFLVVFLWLLYPINRPGFYGGLLGMAIGLPIGLCRYIKMKRQMKQLLDSFDAGINIESEGRE